MFDVLLLAVDQSAPIYINNDDITLKPTNQQPKQKEKFYKEIWPVINNTYGILYIVYSNDSYGQFNCGDGLFNIDFEKYVNSRMLPYWLNNDEICEDMVSLQIKPNIRQQFYNIFQKLIRTSSSRTVMFLCRGQASDIEIIYGTLNLNDFFALLENGEIYTNMCYLINGLN